MNNLDNNNTITPPYQYQPTPSHQPKKKVTPAHYEELDELNLESVAAAGLQNSNDENSTTAESVAAAGSDSVGCVGSAWSDDGVAPLSDVATALEEATSLMYIAPTQMYKAPRLPQK